jgi:hypothetical protein
MSIAEGAKRHRQSQRKIELDVYFLPDRLPTALRFPLKAAGGPDALIKIDQSEGHLSPSSDQTKGSRLCLTICPPGEGHFMGIDLSISEARKLREMLDYVIKWQQDFEARARTAPRPAKKRTTTTAKASEAKARTVPTKTGEAMRKATTKSRTGTVRRS